MYFVSCKQTLVNVMATVAWMFFLCALWDSSAPETCNTTSFSVRSRLLVSKGNTSTYRNKSRLSGDPEKYVRYERNDFILMLILLIVMVACGCVLALEYCLLLWLRC